MLVYGLDATTANGQARVKFKNLERLDGRVVAMPGMALQYLDTCYDAPGCCHGCCLACTYPGTVLSQQCEWGERGRARAAVVRQAVAGSRGGFRI